MTAPASPPMAAAAPSSLRRLLLLLAFAFFDPISAVTFEPNAIRLSCPAAPETPVAIGSHGADTPLLLPPSPSLCTLHRSVTIAGEGNSKAVYEPVARSYDDLDWESVAGKDSRLVEFLCGIDESVDVSTRLCQISGLTADAEDGSTGYYLTSYDRSLSPKDEIARFLEKTTFGPTRSDLTDWETTYGLTDLKHEQALWVKDQIAEPVFSHREYWRERLNPRSLASYSMGESGPRPCEANSRWRKFAFTMDDVYLSEQHQIKLTVETVRLPTSVPTPAPNDVATERRRRLLESIGDAFPAADDRRVLQTTSQIIDDFEGSSCSAVASCLAYQCMRACSNGGSNVLSSSYSEVYQGLQSLYVDRSSVTNGGVQFGKYLNGVNSETTFRDGMNNIVRVVYKPVQGSMFAKVWFQVYLDDNDLQFYYPDMSHEDAGNGWIIASCPYVPDYKGKGVLWTKITIQQYTTPTLTAEVFDSFYVDSIKVDRHEVTSAPLPAETLPPSFAPADTPGLMVLDDFEDASCDRDVSCDWYMCMRMCSSSFAGDNVLSATDVESFQGTKSLFVNRTTVESGKQFGKFVAGGAETFADGMDNVVEATIKLESRGTVHAAMSFQVAFADSTSRFFYPECRSTPEAEGWTSIACHYLPDYEDKSVSWTKMTIRTYEDDTLAVETFESFYLDYVSVLQLNVTMAPTAPSPAPSVAPTALPSVAEAVLPGFTVDDFEDGTCVDATSCLFYMCMRQCGDPGDNLLTVTTDEQLLGAKSLFVDRSGVTSGNQFGKYFPGTTAEAIFQTGIDYVVQVGYKPHPGSTAVAKMAIQVYYSDASFYNSNPDVVYDPEGNGWTVASCPLTLEYDGKSITWMKLTVQTYEGGTEVFDSFYLDFLRVRDDIILTTTTTSAPLTTTTSGGGAPAVTLDDFETGTCVETTSCDLYMCMRACYLTGDNVLTLTTDEKLSGLKSLYVDRSSVDSGNQFGKYFSRAEAESVFLDGVETVVTMGYKLASAGSAAKPKISFQVHFDDASYANAYPDMTYTQEANGWIVASCSYTLEYLGRTIVWSKLTVRTYDGTTETFESFYLDGLRVMPPDSPDVPAPDTPAPPAEEEDEEPVDDGPVILDDFEGESCAEVTSCLSFMCMRGCWTDGENVLSITSDQTLYGTNSLFVDRTTVTTNEQFGKFYAGSETTTNFREGEINEVEVGVKLVPEVSGRLRRLVEVSNITFVKMWFQIQFDDGNSTSIYPEMSYEEADGWTIASCYYEPDYEGRDVTFSKLTLQFYEDPEFATEIFDSFYLNFVRVRYVAATRAPSTSPTATVAPSAPPTGVPSAGPSIANVFPIVEGDFEGHACSAANNACGIWSCLGQCYETVDGVSVPKDMSLSLVDDPSNPSPGDTSLSVSLNEPDMYFGARLFSPDIHEGETYKLSARIKLVDGPAVVAVSVRYKFAIDGVWTDWAGWHTIKVRVVDAVDVWRTMEGYFAPNFRGLDAAAGSNTFQFLFHTSDLAGNPNVASYYLDDVRLVPAPPAPEVADDDSILENSDFETFGTTHWTVTNMGPDAALTVDNGNPHGGDLSLRVSGTTATGGRLFTYITDPSKLMDSEPYFISAYVRIDGAPTTFSMSIRGNVNATYSPPTHRYGGTLAGGSYLPPETIATVAVPSSGEWIECKGIFYPEDPATLSVYQLYFEWDTVGTDVWIDDVSVVPTTHEPSAAPTTLFLESVGYILRFGGEVRTVIRRPFELAKDGTDLSMDNAEYTICLADEIEGSARDFPDRFGVMVDGNCELLRGGNPSINLDPSFVDQGELNLLDFTNLTPEEIVVINEDHTQGSDLLLTTALDLDECENLPDPYDNDYRAVLDASYKQDAPVFALLPDATFAVHDTRLLAKANTVQEPLADGGGSSVIRSATRGAGGHAVEIAVDEEGKILDAIDVTNDESVVVCSSAYPNFYNEDGCRLSYDPGACRRTGPRDPVDDVRLVLDFDSPTLSALLYDIAPKLVLAVTGLPFDMTDVFDEFGDQQVPVPCGSDNPRSRWIPMDELSEGECVTPSLHADTTAALAAAIANSNDENEFLRDIYMWDADGGCHASDWNATQMLVYVASEGRCWKNVHPDHMSIFEFSEFAPMHPSDYIYNSTQTGILEYPSNLPSHTLNAWNDYDLFYPYVTRYGDKMKIEDFLNSISVPTPGENMTASVLAQAELIADTLGTPMLSHEVNANRDGGVLVCGSPGEIAPDPSMDDFFDTQNGGMNSYHWASHSDYEQQKSTVWTHAALWSEDQLRQRMAWALYQHLNVAAPLTIQPAQNEGNLVFYDMYTRNAFGNYRNLLKEVTFSPKTGEQFTFAQSASYSHILQNRGLQQYPDENYGREIMQLFTIGLHELLPDGRLRLDEFGERIITYSNNEILSNARIFTGFAYGSRRGNVEDYNDPVRWSRVDPLNINANEHDWFPKMNLHGGWVGDGYPLCVDLPKRHFLRRGATYKLLGGSSTPRYQYDDPDWDANEGVKRFVLDENSSLYQELCNAPSPGSACSYRNTIVLDDNLVCQGAECKVDTLRVVQVAPGVFYEYIRVPCVQMSFFEGAKKVIGNRQDSAWTMCANPSMPVATRICCGLLYKPSISQAHLKAEYLGELVTYDTNKDSCEVDLGGSVCDPDTLWIVCEGMFCKERRTSLLDARLNAFHWTTASCAVKVRVRSDGLAAIIHDADSGEMDEPMPFISPDDGDSLTYIAFPWPVDPLTKKTRLPSSNDEGCERAADAYYGGDIICDAHVTETAAFASMPPTAEEVLSTLDVGFFDIDMYDSGAFEEVANEGDIVAYKPTGSDDYSTDTVFKVTDQYQKTVFMKNVISVVQIGAVVEIRNPVGFMDLVKPEARDAYYEVEAFLDHLVHHPNTPPFLSKKLISSFGISNPSPRYVSAVATAFRTGLYTWSDGVHDDVVYGDGTYGSLEATAAAIVLDRESTATTLDSDPVYGNLREPLLKVMGFMRSLEFERTPQSRNTFPMLVDMEAKIGQMVYGAPDQFSFFDPEYSPPGQFSCSDLNSPESELINMIYVVGLENGLYSLVRHGLAVGREAIKGGFGAMIYDEDNEEGDYTFSVGRLGFNASGVDLIDELSTLLTSGRLSESSKATIRNAYDLTLSSKGEEAAIRAAQLLIATSPEFHTTNVIRKDSTAREVTPKIDSTNEGYKAIVYLNLFGGVDSYNVLAPDPSCYLYDEYSQVRGSIGLKEDDMSTIPASTSEQPCTSFAVTNLLSSARDLYQSGDLIFFANIGHLNKIVNKVNYREETPTDLFSHTSMEAEAYRVDAFQDQAGTGVLGRMQDALQGKGEAVSSMSVYRRQLILDGGADTGRIADVIPSDGPETLKDAEMREDIDALNGEVMANSGMFADLWAQSLIDIRNKSDTLAAYFNSSSPDFVECCTTTFQGENSKPGVEYIMWQLKTVARLIAAREKRGVTRDTFTVYVGGFDSHANQATVLTSKLASVNVAIAEFWNEMGVQGMQGDVTFVQGSEFGRTLTPNSRGGTDHAWAGNTFAFGGEMKGGRILGSYPKSFFDSDETSIGRGRLLPTTSYDAMWHGIAQWFGVTEETDLDYVLPNRRNFGCEIFTSADLYESGTGSLPGCSESSESLVFTQDLIMSKARYLTPREQRRLCRIFKNVIGSATGDDTLLCMVVDQELREVESECGDYALNADIFVSGETMTTIDALAALNANVDEIATKIADKNIGGVTCVEEAAEWTAAPSPSPSAQPSSAPSVSHAPTASVVPTSSPTEGFCTQDRQCDDGISCTRDRCRKKAGICKNRPLDRKCPGQLICDPIQGCV